MRENHIYQEIINFTKDNDDYFLACEQNVFLPGYIISDSISGKKWEVRLLGQGYIPVTLKNELASWNGAKTIIPSFASCLNHKHGFSKESAQGCEYCHIQEIMDA